MSRLIYFYLFFYFLLRYKNTEMQSKTETSDIHQIHIYTQLEDVNKNITQ